MRAIAIGFIAAAAVVIGAVVLWMVVFAGLSVSGSGGLGAVSVGISELVLPLALLASVAANGFFAHAARQRGGVIWRVHRLHSATLLLLTAALLALAFSIVGLWALLLAGLLFGVQFVLIGVLLALFARAGRPASAS